MKYIHYCGERKHIIWSKLCMRYSDTSQQGTFTFAGITFTRLFDDGCSLIKVEPCRDVEDVVLAKRLLQKLA